MQIGFCGSRSLSPVYAGAVDGAVHWALASGAGVAVGCAAGADALVIAAMLGGGQAARLAVWSAFGPGGVGAAGAVSAVAAVSATAAAGAVVHWWAGGGAAVPLRGRLAARSLALVRSLGAAGLLVGFVDALPPAPFGAGPFPACGSGSWSALAAAAQLGVGVLVVPCGLAAETLPTLPGGGTWGPGPFPGAWAWSPAQLTLF